MLMVDRPHGPAIPGRAPVEAKDGMVAASQPLAAQAGVEILKAGGNAFDAAVATAAVLGVVEPMMTGPGGDVFVLAHVAKTNELIGLNASGFSPEAVTPQFFRERGLDRVPQHGPFPVTVPGAVSGWATLLERYGSMSLADVLAPAIRHADKGFAVTQIIAGDWAEYGEPFAEDAEFNRVFLDGKGKAPRHGEFFRNPELANTLRQIAEGGPQAFYEGPAGRAIVDLLNSLDWPMTMADLRHQHADWVTPISTTFQDVTVHELPPNGQGFAALQMLNILEPYDLADLGHNSADYLHLLVEAKKLAFGDLDRWLADPEQNQLPIQTLISKEYASRQRARIDEKRAAPSYPSGVTGGDTVYLSVVDRERNAVSFINSIRALFGSGLVAPGTGVVLQNRGSDFTLRPGHPNEIGPRKRPYHTIIPAMAFRGGKPWLCFGVMGGLMQPQGHVQVLLNRLVFGMNVQQAGDAARFCHLEAGLGLESGIPPSVTAELARRGHVLVDGRNSFGGYQAVEIDWDTGTLIGGTESRKDGIVVGY